MTQMAASVVSLSETLYPHCLVMVSTQEERATWNISIYLLNPLPSINKADYYYYYYYYHHMYKVKTPLKNLLFWNHLVDYLVT